MACVERNCSTLVPESPYTPHVERPLSTLSLLPLPCALRGALSLHAGLDGSPASLVWSIVAPHAKPDISRGAVMLHVLSPMRWSGSSQETYGSLRGMCRYFDAFPGVNRDFPGAKRDLRENDAL